MPSINPGERLQRWVNTQDLPEVPIALSDGRKDAEQSDDRLRVPTTFGIKTWEFLIRQEETQRSLPIIPVVKESGRCCCHGGLNHA